MKGKYDVLSSVSIVTISDPYMHFPYDFLVRDLLHRGNSTGTTCRKRNIVLPFILDIIAL